MLIDYSFNAYVWSVIFDKITVSVKKQSIRNTFIHYSNNKMILDYEKAINYF